LRLSQIVNLVEDRPIFDVVVSPSEANATSLIEQLLHKYEQRLFKSSASRPTDYMLLISGDVVGHKVRLHEPGSGVPAELASALGGPN
jgi:hypothetical protein